MHLFFPTKCSPDFRDCGAKSLSLQVRQESTHLGQNHGLSAGFFESTTGDLEAIRNVQNSGTGVFIYSYT